MYKPRHFITRNLARYLILNVHADLMNGSGILKLCYHSS